MEQESYTKERIIQAAKSEFAQRGYQGARMSEIARQAEINKAMIHYYYKDKQSLYNEVIKLVFGISNGKEVPVFHGSWKLDTVQKLYVTVYFLFNLFSKATDPYLVRFFFWEMVERQSFLSTYVSEYIEPKLKSVLNVVNEGVSAGTFETGNPRLVVMDLFYFSMLYLVRNRLRPEGLGSGFFFTGETSESILDFLVEQVLKTLSPAGKTISKPEVPQDLIAMLDSVINYLGERKNEGATFQVINQLESILDV